MKKRALYPVISISIAFLLTAVLYRCSSPARVTALDHTDTIFTNINGLGISIELDFLKGESHNHPLMAVWIEDTSGKYIETLFVAESIGKGVFAHAKKTGGNWQQGPLRRPAALPYWGHKRGIKADDGYFIPTPDQPLPDAITGPTPSGNFTLISKPTEEIQAPFNILFEINQPWDWNEFWTNNKYPDDEDYKSSSQPAIVYKATIDKLIGGSQYTMAAIGHSHYAGKDGSLTGDLSTLTSALSIVKSVRIKILP